MTIGAFAEANLQKISAYLNKGLNIELNGQEWKPKDQAGNRQFPITYEGSTYLPVRAVGEAVGAEIGWNGATNTVTINSGSTNVEYYFTRAGDKPEQALIDVINNAQETLDIAIYSLTHPDITGAIRDASKRGVKIRLIEDRLQAAGQSQDSALKILGSAGVELKQNKHSGLMHLKMTIADKKIATGGSFNYSMNAATNSDEVLTLYRDKKIAEDFTKQFEAMWKDDTRFESIEKYIAMPTDDEDVKQEQSDKQQAPTASCNNPKIKGNRNSMIYHVEGQRDYDKTTANVEYFCTEQEAQEAGYRKAAR